MYGEPTIQKVSFDQAVEAMRLTGRDMDAAYKETAKSRLAITCVHC